MGEYIGYLAAFLTTTAFFPQVARTVRTRSTGDFSWLWLGMMLTGVFSWVVYGLYMKSIQLIAANIVTFGCLAVLAWIKARQAKQEGRRK